MLIFPLRTRHTTPSYILEQYKTFFSCKCDSAKATCGRSSELWIKQYLNAAVTTQTEKNNAMIQEIHTTSNAWKKSSAKTNHVRNQNAVSNSTTKRLKEWVKSAGPVRWEHQGKDNALHVAPKKQAVVEFIKELETNLGTCMFPWINN